MGCSSSKSIAAAAPAAAPANEPPQQQAAPEAQPTQPVQPVPETQPASEAAILAADVAKGTEQIEQAKTVSKEAFAKAMKRLLDVAIDGYPKALRSTMARRNELLREVKGDQDAAAEKIKGEAGAMTEEGKTWLLGLVPYVGLPAQMIYPTWRLLRRVCLLAAVFGLDLSLEDTRARILQVFAGLRAVPATEYAIETAVQLAWVAFAGPVAGFLPMGTLVSKVSNVEGHVVDAVGRDSFKDRGRKVPEAEYMVELDAEPTSGDYVALAKDGTVYALYSTFRAGLTAAAVAQDKERREGAMSQAVDLGKNATKTSVAVGGQLAAGAMLVGAGAAALAMDHGSKAADKAKAAIGGPTGSTAASGETKSSS